jgi:chemotaxis protein MotB
MKKIKVFSSVAFLLLAGCVSQATFDKKAKEADTLVALSDNLQGQIKNLTAERDALKKQQEDLLNERDALQTEKAAVEKERDILRVKTGDLSQKAEKAERLERATHTYQDLQKKLEKEIQEGKVQLSEMKNRLTMTMVDKIIFPSGSTEISKDGKLVLDKVISILKDIKDKRIQVEGHTDNVPIVSALKKRYPTNWELSTARATEVVRYLQEQGGLDPKQLSATGYSEYQPVAPNDTDDGKHKNRRIEIVLLPLLQ